MGGCWIKFSQQLEFRWSATSRAPRNGDGDAAGACMVRNPAHDSNDDSLATGASYWMALVQEFFAK